MSGGVDAFGVTGDDVVAAVGEILGEGLGEGEGVGVSVAGADDREAGGEGDRSAYSLLLAGVLL